MSGFEKHLSDAVGALANSIFDCVYSGPIVGPKQPIKCWSDYANDPFYTQDGGGPGGHWRPVWSHGDPIDFDVGEP